MKIQSVRPENSDAPMLSALMRKIAVMASLIVLITPMSKIAELVVTMPFSEFVFLHTTKTTNNLLQNYFSHQIFLWTL